MDRSLRKTDASGASQTRPTGASNASRFSSIVASARKKANQATKADAEGSVATEGGSSQDTSEQAQGSPGTKSKAIASSSDEGGLTPADQSAEDSQDSPVGSPVGVHAGILSKRPGKAFIIRTFKFDGDGQSQPTGSILSQSLDKILAATSRTNAGALTLAALRKLVPRMSRYARLEKFCTPSGTLIDEESISFSEYLDLEDESSSEKASGGIPSLNLYFGPTSLGALAGKGADDQSAGSAPDLAEGPSIKADRDADYGELLTAGEPKSNLIEVEPNEEGGEGKSAGMLTEDEWAVVLRNCSVFYGWMINPVSKKIVQAPKPAFRLRSKVDDSAVSKIPDFKPESNIVMDGTPKDGDAVKAESSEQSLEDPRVDNLHALTSKHEKGVPNFRVNDDSRIEITAHKSELEVSMAKSDFTEQSTEASVSASGYGFSGSVSGGYASSTASTDKSSDSSSYETLIARYMFPRCDLILWPDELEPTEELAQLIEQIRTSKSIKALRKLQAEYGQFFCQKLTLGGRLLSTTIRSSKESKSLEERKESFKAAVGASVSGSYGGVSGSASVKHEQGGGSANAQEKSQSQQNENVVFEAVGGNTTLANNPSSWSATVSASENWRVINRDGLSSLVEVLSALPGYEPVQSWFVRAVPALSQYIRLNESHECKARLRVVSPTNSLSKLNEKGTTAFYLGHDVTTAVTPYMGSVDTINLNNIWARIEVETKVPIFNPPTYRAPTILGYENYMVGATKYGAAYDTFFVQTEWSIIAPFDTELCHGTRIILRTNTDPSKASATHDPNGSHMVVFRNAQGEFLPAMSDSDEYQYWRLLKTDSSKKHIKPGDEVRLAWDFRDQMTGWRDFTEDVFGRRQVGAPAGHDAKRPLFLKVPWPRFENANNATALIMSSDMVDLAAKAVNIDNKGKAETVKYCMQDLKLRIDNVTNNGKGDAEDYMLNKLKMESPEQKITFKGFKKAGLPMQMASSMFWFGIR